MKWTTVEKVGVVIGVCIVLFYIYALVVSL